MDYNSLIKLGGMMDGGFGFMAPSMPQLCGGTFPIGWLFNQKQALYLVAHNWVFVPIFHIIREYININYDACTYHAVHLGSVLFLFLLLLWTNTGRRKGN
jgi:hypothetical protein